MRRLGSLSSAAALLALVGFSTAPAAGVAAATGAVCTVSGGATISPGLGLVPGPQATTFNGSAACTGTAGGVTAVQAVGGFSGGVSCKLGSVEVGLECTIDFTATVDGQTETCAGGTFVQAGADVHETCVLANGDVEKGHVVFTPSPAIQNPVVTVSFSGTAEVAGAA